MKNSMIWLSTSLFCSKCEWNKLFADGIVPFVKDNRILQAYTIELNYLSGENIRLSFLTNDADAQQLAKNTDGHFKDFFLSSNFSSPDIKLPVNGIFKLFPVNTIQYGLYPPQEIERKEKENYSLSIELSQIILDALKDDSIDDEAILTLAFYLQIGLIKVINDFDEKFINTLKTTTQRNFETISINIIKARFEESREILSEITTDILHGANKEDIPVWLEQWMILCKTEIERVGKNMNATSVYGKISNAVRKHLGITPQMNDMLAYFIERSLVLINKEKNRPDVIIVGAQKCGTTTLHHSLVAHSNISGPVNPQYDIPVKEIDFFYTNKNWEKGVDWYFSHFVGSESIFLESSPNYLSLPSCFNRMHEVLPNAKLIICLRNPVYRAFSQYNDYKQRLPYSSNWDWEHDGDFLTNIKFELNKDITDIETKANFSRLLLRGVYIHQIQQLLKYYDRSQIYISIMDRWDINYEKELNNILTFLSLKKETLPKKIFNNNQYGFEPFDNEAKEILTNFYRPYNQQLFELLGYEIPEWN